MKTPAASPSSPHRTPLVIAAGAAVFLLTLFVAVRGGLFSVDVRGVAPENLPRVDALIHGRLVGVLYIVLSSLPFLAAFAAAAAGWGWPLRRWLAPRADDRWIIQGAAGLAAMLLIDYLLALAGGMNVAGGWLVCAGGIALLLAGLWVERADAKPAPFRPPRLAIATAAPVALLLVAACCPPGTLWAVEAFGYDVMSYHLQVPRQWLAAGRMTGLHENVYSYLPLLVEAGYMHLGAMAGGVYQAIYLCQLASLCAAVLAAASVGALAARLAPPGSAAMVRWATAAIFLATPWTLITGSLAYEEMPMLALGGAALLLAFDPHERSWKSAAVIGLLLGGATLAKLTAGFMIALPVGLLVLFDGLCPAPSSSLSLRERAGVRAVPSSTTKSPPPATPGAACGLAPRPITSSRAFKRAAVAALAGLLTLSPYLLRNAAWTGNPVFPFAADTLGRGHWSKVNVDRWNRGHHVDDALPQRLDALGQQWLFNRGYGAIAGQKRHVEPGTIESRNIARFEQEGGFPTLVVAVLLGLALLLADGERRRPAAALALMIVLQLICWMFVTHLQSRFLIAWLLPGCVLLGAGLGRLDALVRVGPRPFTWAALLLVAMLIAIGGQMFFNQTIAGLPPWQIVDALPAPDQFDKIDWTLQLTGDHPINHLPAGSKTLLIADNTHLLYIRGPMVYSSAFDTSPLGELLRAHPGDYAGVTAELKKMGITHVWVHLPELERLTETYGYDKDITPETLAKLAATGWTPVPGMDYSQGSVVLYRLP